MLLKAEKREIKGKKVASLRGRGLLPAVLYGGGHENMMLLLDGKEFKKLWQDAGGSTVIELSVDDARKNVLIHDVAMDPVKGEPIHVDFYEIRMDKPIVTKVAVKFIGESPAVKNLGGVLVKVIHELEVEALPKDLPSEITVDLSRLKAFNDQFTVGDLNLGESVRISLKADDVIVLAKEPAAEEAPAEERTIADIEVEKKGKEEAEEVAAEGAEGK